MLFKIISGIIAVGLAVAFYSIPALKLLEIPMLIVVAIGVALSIFEFVETLREED
ncbi:MAG: hypothetical protein JSW68_00015 [Burkholderiales bacterium]|nr:MAG: hypothetical protein JSW68_00015 [Burkholderiales bacterium]